MTRSIFFFLFFVVTTSVVLNSATAGAQHYQPGPRGEYSPGLQQSIPMPMGNPGMGFGRPFGHHQYGMPYLFAVYVAQPSPVTSYGYSYPIVYPTPVMPIPLKSDKTSTPASRLKSLDFQAKGDQRMREQKWSEARAAYASAISAAPDQADAHFKLAVCYVVIQRFDGAIRELKRALNLDPRSVRTAKSMKALLGPDSQIIRNSIISKVGIWAKEDSHNSDRQFLYGAMLHLDDDPRSREILESALKANGAEDSRHISRFLNPNADMLNGPNPGLDAGIPVLNDLPVAVAIARPAIDLRFPDSSSLLARPDAPVPMPDGPLPMPNRFEPLPGAPVPMP